MTSFNQPAWRGIGDPNQHAELLAWEAEQDALRAPIPSCTCFDAASCEWLPSHPCDWCRAADLAAIDRDGHDDKRETGAA